MASALLYQALGLTAILVPWPLAGCLILAFGLVKFGFKFNEHYERRSRKRGG